MNTATSIAAAAAVASTAMAANPLGPGSGPWAEEDPTSHGLDEASLDKAWEYLQETGDGRGCMVVVKDGAIVYEKYDEVMAYSRARPTYSFSNTKTLGAMMAGIPVREGVLDVDAPIKATYDIESPKDYDVTARQIMAGDISGAFAGEKWEYDFFGDLWINKLSDIVSTTMKEKSSEVFEREFREPMGLSDEFYWGAPFSADENFAIGSGGTCRDWARFGQLLLNEGKWAGRGPILTKDYIKEMTQAQSKRASDTADYANTCYGLLTWTSYFPDPATTPGQCLLPTGETVEESKSGYPEVVPQDINAIVGAFGQITMQFPSENMTVTTMGFTLPRAQLKPHQLFARVAEATWCEALPGNRCGDWVKKTGEEVSEGGASNQELVDLVRDQINTIGGGVFDPITDRVPDELLETLVYTILARPELVSSFLACVRSCTGSDLPCIDTCVAATSLGLQDFTFEGALLLLNGQDTLNGAAIWNSFRIKTPSGETVSFLRENSKEVVIAAGYRNSEPEVQARVARGDFTDEELGEIEEIGLTAGDIQDIVHGKEARVARRDFTDEESEVIEDAVEDASSDSWLLSISGFTVTLAAIAALVN